MIRRDSIHRFVSDKAAQFEESVIRQMTQVCARHHGVNLAQGFPDFPTPLELQQAAMAAIREGHNQYARTWGAPALVAAVADKMRRFQGMQIDAEREVTICCGTTEAMIASLLATVNPGDEIIVTCPFYENYGADTILCGAIPRYVTLHPVAAGGFAFNPDELAAAFNDKTRGIIVNTPHNPCGKVYTREDLQLIADLCIQHDALAFTDEMYEHILYDGHRHISLATLPGMAERTVTIGGMSKTYSVTGWRIAWAIAQPQITAAIRKVHDFLTVGAPHPFQITGAAALGFPDSFYEELARDYTERRDCFVKGLREAGFDAHPPEGAYYVMVDVSGFMREGEDDTALAMRLVEEAGVATVPGSSFYNPPSLGAKQIRFCFCKQIPTLEDALARLRDWAGRQGYRV